MIKEILVRCFTKEVMPLQAKICQFIEEHTDMIATPVDHSRLTLADFDVGNHTPISIDKYLAHFFNIPYFRVSRVFDIHGNIKERMIRIPQGEFVDAPLMPFCIIDSDICSGETMKMACRVFDTTKFNVPLKVGLEQDLIDVEDLIYDDSLLDTGGTVSYLVNSEFFSKRTSLPESLFPLIYKMIVDTDIRSNLI